MWQYFLREKGEQSAQSRQCHNIIKTVGGTTISATDGCEPSSSKISRPARSGAGPIMDNFLLGKDEPLMCVLVTWSVTALIG